MVESKDKVTVGLRLTSMIVDHFVMTFIAVLIAMPAMAINMFNAFNLDHEPDSFGLGGGALLFAIGFSFYFNKDILDGRSPAKRTLKLQVVDNKTGLAATPIKCLIRNLTIALWPVEVIFVLINSHRRLGDKIAGTRIESVESPEKLKTNWLKVTIALLIGLTFSTFVSLPFILISLKSAENQVLYVKDSLNESKSQQLNKLFETKLEELIREADLKHMIR